MKLIQILLIKQVVFNTLIFMTVKHTPEIEPLHFVITVIKNCNSCARLINIVTCLNYDRVKDP